METTLLRGGKGPFRHSTETKGASQRGCCCSGHTCIGGNVLYRTTDHCSSQEDQTIMWKASALWNWDATELIKWNYAYVPFPLARAKVNDAITAQSTYDKVPINCGLILKYSLAIHHYVQLLLLYMTLKFFFKTWWLCWLLVYLYGVICMMG